MVKRKGKDRRLMEASFSINQEYLLELSKEEDPFIRARVASNPYTPLSVLEDLSRDVYVMVLEKVALNPKINDKILNELANSNYPMIKKMVLKNKNVSAAIVKLLAADLDNDVKQAALNHTLCPQLLKVFS
jgi:hypothetical protein